MKLRNGFAVVLTAAFVVNAIMPTTSGAQEAKKKRVAVFAFEDKSDQRVRWWSGQNAGEGISDMLITELVKSGKYTVLERSEINKLLAEQDLGSAGIVTPESAAKAGQMLGVEIAVIGAVTEFGHSRSDVGGTLKDVGVGLSSQDVTVAVDVRLVNTNTGEILTAENVRKSKSKKGISFRKESLSFRSRNKFDNSLIGKASRDAVEEIIEMIAKQAESIAWEGKIVKATDTSVIINAGAEAGVRIGDRFVIVREGEELIDPDTGLSLGSTEKKIGVIEVVKNDIGNGKASTCKIISGSGFARGDIVREK